jgi:hypothetical protein
VGEATLFVSPGLAGETKRSVSDDAEGVGGVWDLKMSSSRARTTKYRHSGMAMADSPLEI